MIPDDIDTAKPGRGHNGGPPLDPGAGWRLFCWKKACARAWQTPPREIALRRLDLATLQVTKLLDGASDPTISPDGTSIVTASADKTARIWDARTGEELAVLSGHGDQVNSAAYSPDGALIVTASAGLDGLTTRRPAVCANSVSGDSLWCSIAPMPPP